LSSAVQGMVHALASGGRLRTPAGRLFTSEAKTLTDLSVYQGQTFVLECKALPKENEISLRFIVLEPAAGGTFKHSEVRDLVFPNDAILSVVKTMMATEAELDPSVCKLRLSNKKGAPGTHITNEQQTVKAQNISNGTTLFLEHQKLRAKNQISVALFLETADEVKSQERVSQHPFLVLLLFHVFLFLFISKIVRIVITRDASAVTDCK
jgi:hypothetical protein